MTDNYRKRMLALTEEMRAHGVKPYTFAPPVYRLAWRLGYHIKPPMYHSFLTLSLGMAVPFGILLALFSWFGPWPSEDRSVIKTLVTSTVAAAFFGLAMAVEMRRQARKVALPALEDMETPDTER